VKRVVPAVRLTATTVPDLDVIREYLQDTYGVGLPSSGGLTSPEGLVEFAGRLCYRSFAPHLNPNVTKIREDQQAYLENILKSGHGSVLEHISYSFIFSNVSRVFTHELARHRAGTAVSQESLRYVRLQELPFWFPEWALADPAVLTECTALLEHLEFFQQALAGYFKLDDPATSFAEKKRFTSFMRRFAPEGVATQVLWTANARALRHVIKLRTAEGAEEEMRLVFSQVAEIMQHEAPYLFGDFRQDDADAWVPEYHNV
jgi:thymidylate synthase (FAD)